MGASNDSSILLNRTLGLGLRKPFDRSIIEQIDSVYQRHQVARYFLHTYPQTLADGTTIFEKTRLVMARGWMKFQRDNSPPIERDTQLEIRRVDEAGAIDFGKIVAAAFGITGAAVPLLAGLACDARRHLFVSFKDDQPLGAGALFIDNGVAWFEWGATDERFRRQGSQGAIMRARLQTALDVDCSMMFTETGEAVGDDSQHSYGNIRRYGFKESILRQNWAPQP